MDFERVIISAIPKDASKFRYFIKASHSFKKTFLASWQARHIMNFLTHMEEDKDDFKYLQIVYDDINQLIDLVESYRDTINSVREIHTEVYHYS
jgi:Mg2+ and Co2+ transporter CorA